MGIQVDGKVGNQTLTYLKTSVAVQNAPSAVKQVAMASAANAQVGGIKDNTILMSTTTFNTTLSTVSSLKKSTGGTVNTTVVGGQVKITGVTTPSTTTVKSTTTPSATTTQGKGNSNTSLAGKTSSIGSGIKDFTVGAAIATDNNMFFGGAQAVTGNPSLPNSTAYKVGKVVGDIVSLVVGRVSIVGGIAGEAGGFVLDATGVGAFIGVPINVASAGAIVYGGTVIVGGTKNLSKDTASLFSGNEGAESKIKTNLGNEIDITPSSNHSTTSNNPGLKGAPNSSVDILDGNGNIKTRRWFGSDGIQTRDVDFTNHGNPKLHPEWPHEHGPR